MRILSIESSCDDSALAYTDGTNTKLLWHEKISQEASHSHYGGVVPELASRLFARDLVQLLENFKQNFSLKDITHIAVTNEPGLSTSLLEGVIMAKALALSLNIPLLGINHLKGHIYSLFIESEAILPLCVLLVSGGHTMLLECYSYNDMRVIANTLDDSFGECYDKAAKMLGLGYPGGLIIDSLAQMALKENIAPIALPIPLVNQNIQSFSFSGLKNAFRLQLEKMELKTLIQDSKTQDIKNSTQAKALALGLQESATTHLIQKCRSYMKQNSHIKHFAIVGGASANSMLREKAQSLATQFDKKLLMSELKYCSDNAAMIGRAAIAKIRHENTIDIESKNKAIWNLDSHPNGRVQGLGCNSWNLDSKNYNLNHATHLDLKQSLDSNKIACRIERSKISKSIDSKTACHTKPLGEVSSIESNKDISCLRTRTSKALAHTCKYDKITESIQNKDSIHNTNKTKQNLDSRIYNPLSLQVSPRNTEIDTES
ncbi:tRNA (adenosine(37)-N6)-threonylcarbamoyltransferase complex transferase subunit TsaD [Helicobacter bilis]|uniref:tRNA (adenosine(37)-N6)-threonylcarbamoyltransferase complex transferase subunit TsaD n=1 Tax=Helicobacter bilis TaxID=37372 RepID=UPI0010FEF35A|nr:tRNA (adenosine(37)-N6)-threonylcarbamoyltransferase complex transferase subunit TsaD [Helicobacter bilis]MCI7410816.1 tRNA (adenosine(37)-N6)-threonylcarbamoyltransferase complex transferase subunit TsaD [Helicobacter bilis]MDD7296255.1 tRNA (adenosine(37)-N6)-threonylcarbamoyltransferase complex transferase subunit TsaD [Helicobacter bilis]MDY4399215.1 tRNA (adenosine(37)-N6)-threonylcarbamoyltransferase complex transferase subunit TsaD [Helicobacter bilis]TLE07385.1 tRNA (adenosine(37)-N6